MPCQVLLPKVSTPIEFHNVNIHKFDIQYAVAGQGPPMVLIHGANIGWAAWYANIDDLSDHYTLYMIDLPGCGESTRIDFTVAHLQHDFVDVVHGFIRHLKLSEPPIVAGHSFSSWIVLQLALQNKLKGSPLLLINPMGFSRHVPFAQKPVSILAFAKFISRKILKPVPEKMITFFKGVMHKHDYLTSEFIDHYCQVISAPPVSHPLMFIHSLTRNFKIKKEIDLRDHLTKIKNHTLIFHGERDPLTAKNLVHQHYNRIPKVSLTYFPDAGHVPHMELPEQFSSRLMELLPPQSTTETTNIKAS